MRENKQFKEEIKFTLSDILKVEENKENKTPPSVLLEGLGSAFVNPLIPVYLQC
jgi:hypothetical protein